MRHFPGVVKIDLERFMPVPEIKWHLEHIGFDKVHHHKVTSEPTSLSIDNMVNKFKKRYISTLALVPQADFEKNLAIFEKNLKQNYSNNVETSVEMTFIEAQKL